MRHRVGHHQLPPGFPATLADPPRAPVRARPAATVAILRPSEKEGNAFEALLMRRSGRVGFIPGAWVFPGGRVDRQDGAPDVLSRLGGSSPGEMERRLGTHPGQGEHVDEKTAPPSAGAYFVAALRETFEEVGILFTRSPERCLSVPVRGDEALSTARKALLHHRSTFLEVLEGGDLDLDAGALRYVGHWITPEVEPRRYDTRFFAAVVPRACTVHPDGQEMADALWLTPGEALGRNREGELPMVFPTLKTLEALRPFSSPEDALDVLGSRPVPRLLPRLTAADGGVEIVL